MADIPLHTKGMSSSSSSGRNNSGKRGLGGDTKEDVVTNAAAKKTKFSVPDFMTMSFEIVNISVGEPAVKIPVYKDLVCSVAPYFRGAFKYAFREAEEGAIALPDVEELVFRTFLKWCHSHSQTARSGGGSSGSDILLQNRHQNSGTPSKLFDEFQTEWPEQLKKLTDKERDQRYYDNDTWQASQSRLHLALLKLYIFADKYSVDQLRDDVLSTLLGHCHSWDLWPASIELINHAYDNLPSTSPFLRFLVLSHCYNWEPPESAGELARMKDLHHNYLLDIVISSSRRMQEPGQGETDATKAVPKRAEHGLANSCLFHEHLVFDQAECRERLARCTYVFRDLLQMCVEQAGMESSNE